jgi:hypothetical protein
MSSGSIDDPFADPQPRHADLSREEDVKVSEYALVFYSGSKTKYYSRPEPQPYQLERDPSQATYEYIPANLSMPLPAIHDVIASK